jgi:hypothetical protein
MKHSGARPGLESDLGLRYVFRDVYTFLVRAEGKQSAIFVAVIPGLL